MAFYNALVGFKNRICLILLLMLVYVFIYTYHYEIQYFLNIGFAIGIWLKRHKFTEEALWAMKK
jgi:uncharacterized membrane protein YesL